MPVTNSPPPTRPTTQSMVSRAPLCILSNRVRKPLIEQCRDLLGAQAPQAPKPESRSAACFRIFGVDPESCPKCKTGRIVVRATWCATRVPLDDIIASLLPRAP